MQWKPCNEIWQLESMTWPCRLDIGNGVNYICTTFIEPFAKAAPFDDNYYTVHQPSSYSVPRALMTGALDHLLVQIRVN